MHAFLILCSVISVAYAGTLGYNYENNNGPALGGGQSGGQVGGGQIGGAGFGGEAGGSSYGAPSAGGSNYGATSAGGSNYGAPSAGGSNYGGQSAGGSSYGAPATSGSSYSAPAEYNKEYFTYTAPEHEFNDASANNQEANSLKKNLRVIFIKGPENTGLENAALQLAKSAGDDRTAIYVLNKQADLGDLANKLQSINTQNANKPEVHFVKYRTQADAEHAQHSIQSQYDGLGGQSSSHNGGVAPVLNYASKAPAPAPQQSYGSPQIGSVENTYLPPNKRL